MYELNSQSPRMFNFSSVLLKWENGKFYGRFALPTTLHISELIKWRDKDVKDYRKLFIWKATDRIAGHFYLSSPKRKEGWL